MSDFTIDHALSRDEIADAMIHAGDETFIWTMLKIGACTEMSATEIDSEALCNSRTFSDEELNRAAEFYRALAASLNGVAP